MTKWGGEWMNIDSLIGMADLSVIHSINCCIFYGIIYLLSVRQLSLPQPHIGEECWLFWLNKFNCIIWEKRNNICHGRYVCCMTLYAQETNLNIFQYTSFVVLVSFSAESTSSRTWPEFHSSHSYNNSSLLNILTSLLVLPSISIVLAWSGSTALPPSSCNGFFWLIFPSTGYLTWKKIPWN